MKDLFLFAFLSGGFFFAAIMAYALPFASCYSGRGLLTVAAVLSALSFCALGSHTFALVMTMTSFVIILPPLFRSSKDSKLRRPIVPALAISAANAWNTYVIILVSDSAFMGGNC